MSKASAGRFNRASRRTASSFWLSRTTKSSGLNEACSTLLELDSAGSSVTTSTSSSHAQHTSSAVCPSPGVADSPKTPRLVNTPLVLTRSEGSRRLSLEEGCRGS